MMPLAALEAEKPETLHRACELLQDLEKYFEFFPLHCMRRRFLVCAILINVN